MRPAESDVKDMVVSGCRVQLGFSQTHGRWIVQGTVECGLAENSGKQTFETAAYVTREEAEQEALARAADLMGRNVDRNTSRVKNWS